MCSGLGKRRDWGGSWSHPPACCPYLGPNGAASSPHPWSGLNPHPLKWTLDKIALPLPSQGPCSPSAGRGSRGYLAGEKAGTDLFGLWIYYPTLPVEVALLPCGESRSHEPQSHFEEAQGKVWHLHVKGLGRVGPKAGEPLALRSAAVAFQTNSSGHQQLSARRKNHPLPIISPRILWGAPSPK